MADNLDTLFKKALSAAKKGRNSTGRVKAVKKARAQVMTKGGYVWKCIGPKKGSCTAGAVPAGEPTSVRAPRKKTKNKATKSRAKVAKKTTKKRAKRGKAVVAPAKRVKRAGAKTSGRKKMTLAERKAWGAKMKAAREAKKRGK